MFDLTGKTALVTGATGGIGGAIAAGLHAQGAHVVLSGTRESVLADVAPGWRHPVTGERVQDALRRADQGGLERLNERL